MCHDHLCLLSMSPCVRWYAGICHIEISYVKYMYFAVRQLDVAKLIPGTRYTSNIAAHLNAFFLCEEKLAPTKMAITQNDIFQHFSIIRSGVFQKPGIIVVSPVLCCLGCLSRYLLDAVWLGVKVLSPDILSHVVKSSWSSVLQRTQPAFLA